MAVYFFMHQSFPNKLRNLKLREEASKLGFSKRMEEGFAHQTFQTKINFLAKFYSQLCITWYSLRFLLIETFFFGRSLIIVC